MNYGRKHNLSNAPNHNNSEFKDKLHFGFKHDQCFLFYF